ncbi:MAG: DUF4830 domain-containing protein [Oscillospiraceae bacterium]|nr:DUF4830 domain-containing protein [Oscillospiraceae bacterium]
MVIVSAKVNKRKVLLGLIAAVCIIILLAVLLKNADAPEQDTPQEQVVSMNGGTNEERLAFLERYGWRVDETPTETQEVRIPQEFNEVFTRYNELQKEQGFDLNEFAGKTAKRYVYAVTNYPDGSDGHYATILVHKNKIIGGDVTGPAQNGGIHGFAMPGER